MIELHHKRVDVSFASTKEVPVLMPGLRVAALGEYHQTLTALILYRSDYRLDARHQYWPPPMVMMCLLYHPLLTRFPGSLVMRNSHR